MLRAALIFAVGFWVYWPALYGDWVWDDVLYITGNPLLHDPARFWKTWFEPGSWSEYYPLHETIQMLQWQILGNHTFGYHLANVILHVINALLVWKLLSKFGLRLAWIGGLIFAIHPVQVESVAYISELKNTLSLPFFLLAMYIWIDYEENKLGKDYRWALGLFLVAMLCKITMAPFPLVILLYAWWKRGRIEWKDLKASAPFFATSIVLGVITLKAASIHLRLHPMDDAIPLGGFFSRIACIGLTLSFYFGECIWPVNPVPVYPQWNINPPSPVQFLPWPIWCGVIYWFWTKRRGWGRHAFLGLGFFFLNLLPFSGLVANSFMKSSWVMDHLLYVPIIGLIGLAVATLDQLSERLSPFLWRCSTGVVALAMALMAWESHAYAAIFVNQETFWSYAVAHNPGCWVAHNNLGIAFIQNGRGSEAVQEYEKALNINPGLIAPRVNLGNALAQMGKMNEAMDRFQEALRIRPGDIMIKKKICNALRSSGQYEEAANVYLEILRKNPNDVEAHTDLGVVLIQMGRRLEGIQHYKEAIRLQPDFAPAHYNLGIVLGESHDMDGAIDQFQQAARLDPDDAETRYNLAVALTAVGRFQEAIEQCQEAVRINPSYTAARNFLFQLKEQRSASKS